MLMESKFLMKMTRLGCFGLGIANLHVFCIPAWLKLMGIRAD